MNSNTVKKVFGPSFGSLHRDAQRLLQALNDSTIGPPVVAMLPATFVADFTAQVDSTAQAVVDQSGAVGAVRGSTVTQTTTMQDLIRRMAAARRVANHAFPGQDAFLHDEFQVGGGKRAQSMADVVQQARKVLAACAAHAAELAPLGWGDACQTGLSSAIDAAANGSIGHANASDAKEGLTGQRNVMANTLYKRCRALQSVVDMVYPASLARRDATALEARARFLMGEFPSRSSAAATPAPVPAAPTPPPASPSASPSATETHPLAG